jgi:drug/metabolite transporter (DMT)-like permease
VDAASRSAGLVLLAALLWSTGGLGIKAVAQPPLAVACYRSAVAALALVLFLGRPRWRWTPGFLLTVASYAGCVTTFVVATKWTSAANAIFLQYSGVVWVLLLAPAVLGEPLRGRDAIAIAAALVGMALFFVGDLEALGRAGDWVALLSSLCFAALILSLRRGREKGAEEAVIWGNVVTAAILSPFVAGGSPPDLRSAAVLVYLGVFQIGLAYALFTRGLRRVPAATASLLGMLEPVANPIWVFLILGEEPRPQALVGGLVVLGAIAWRTLGAGSPPPAVPAPD